MSGLAILFLIFDSVTKVVKVPAVLQASAQLEYPVRLIPLIGIILLRKGWGAGLWHEATSAKSAAGRASVPG